MKAAVLLIAMVLLFGKIETKILFTSCARMDVPGMSKAAQGLCISSCKFQVTNIIEKKIITKSNRLMFTAKVKQLFSCKN